MFSWVHNNIWDTNFPAQQGFEHVFRYSVGVTGTEEAAAAALPAEHLAARVAAVAGHPLVAVRARAGAHAEPPAQQRFLTVDEPRVRLVGLTSPDEETLLVRLQSLADTAVSCGLTTPFAVAQAFRTTYLGLDPGELELRPDGVVPVEVPPLGTAAVTLRLSRP